MSFSRRIGACAVDQKPRALPAVGDDAIAEDQALARLELDLEAHAIALLGGCSACGYWNSRSTFWSACAASDSAVVDSCWRVCKASRLAPSSFVGERQVVGAGLQRVDHRLGEILADLRRSRGSSRRPCSACARWRARRSGRRPRPGCWRRRRWRRPDTEAAIARSPAVVSSTPAIASVELPSLLKVTVSVSPASRLLPLKPEIAGQLVDLGEHVVELAGERGAHGGVGGLLRLARGRLRRLDQLGDRGHAVIGGLQRLLRDADRVEQGVQVVGAHR